MKLNAEQANLANQYKDVKLRLRKTIENIKFNKTCLEHNLVPSYIIVKISVKSKAAIKAKKLAESAWIRNEIKALYAKKDILNKLLLKKHLNLLNSIHVSQQYSILSHIDQQLDRKIAQKKNTQDKKIRNLMEKQHTKEIIKCSHIFHKRVINYTDISFDENELKLLNKGLQFNFPNNKKTSMLSELLNIESAIKRIKISETRESTRVIMSNKAKNLAKIQSTSRRYNTKFSELRHAATSIRDKITEHDAVITKADKGNSIVILYNKDYVEKVTDFFNKNNITALDKDPTAINSKQINKIISNSKTLLNANEITYLKVTNPQAPIFRGLPKIHKINAPIRPLVNFMPSPAYKVAKKLDQIIRREIVLENNHSIKNSIELIDKIKTQSIKNNHKLASLDIVNLYTSVPIQETINILQQNLQKNSNLPHEAIDELINLTTVILKQNYFKFQNNFYHQTEGLAMGSPLSSIMSEIFLNYIENRYLFTDANRHLNKIIFYYRYVDDTIILFDGNSRQLSLLNSYISNIHKNLSFTLEEENNNTLNFLDITITKQNGYLKFKIYRKPTCTDQTIHADSHHPYPQKLAAYNSFVHRLITIPMDPNDYNEEVNIIKHIAISNGYNSGLIDKLINKHKNRSNRTTTQKTYISAEYGTFLSNKFHNTLAKENITVSFKTNNKLVKMLKVHSQVRTPDFDRNGVYKLNCDDCPRYYIGQTSRSFKKRFKEHLPKHRANQQTSNFAEHLISENHNYTNIDKNMSILHFSKDFQHRNTLEEFEIYRAAKFDKNNILNDKISFQSNCIYDTTIRIMEQLNAADKE